MSGSYDATKLIVRYGGFRLTGFAEGSHVNVARMTDRFTSANGPDGDTAVVKTNDYRVEVTIRLSQASQANALLSQLLREDDINGTFRSMSIEDLNGGSLYIIPVAWVKREPEGAFEDSPAAREWMFEGIQAEMQHQGLTFNVVS